MDFLAIEPKYASLFARLGLRTPEQFVEFFDEGERPGQKAMIIKPRRLKAPGIAPVEIYYKQYEFGRSTWTYWGRPSKARAEYKNYGVFRRLGIPTTERVACGEVRDSLGRLRRAFIITVAIPASRPLPDFFTRRCPRRDSREARAMRDAIWRQLAKMTRTIHTAGFFHHDLVWRNVLVTMAAGVPKLWWIDCPSGSYIRVGRHRRRLKDLASLDKLASQHCTWTERVRFLLRYLDQKRLGKTGKRLIRETLQYRRTRWPEDWEA